MTIKCFIFFSSVLSWQTVATFSLHKLFSFAAWQLWPNALQNFPFVAVFANYQVVFIFSLRKISDCSVSFHIQWRKTGRKVELSAALSSIGPLPCDSLNRTSTFGNKLQSVTVAMAQGDGFWPGASCCLSILIL